MSQYWKENQELIHSAKKRGMCSPGRGAGMCKGPKMGEKRDIEGH